MDQDSYFKLMERMNWNLAKHPPTDKMRKVLQALFREEQAELAGSFPLGAYTPKELSAKLGRDEAVLDKMLTKMSANGLIFEAARENGDKEYSVLPFEPGLMEMQFLRGRDDEHQRKILKLFEDAWAEEAAILVDFLKNPPEEAKVARSAPKASRIVGVEEVISGDKEAIPYEKLSSIIERMNAYAVGECSCVQIKKLNGDRCKTTSPSKRCVWLGKAADYLVERGYATRLTKEECYTVFKKCEEAGLVHYASNYANADPVCICNCCKCCCYFLGQDRLFRQAGFETGLLETTNFRAQVNEENCTQCGECIDYCQLRALQLTDDKLTVNPKWCVGCGVCVTKCPSESISLVRISNNKGIMLDMPIVGAGV